VNPKEATQTKIETENEDIERDIDVDTAHTLSKALNSRQLPAQHLPRITLT